MTAWLIHTIKCVLTSISVIKCLLYLLSLWPESCIICGEEYTHNTAHECPLNFDCTTRQKHWDNPNLKHDTSWLLTKSSLQVLMCISEIKKTRDFIPEHKFCGKCVFAEAFSNYKHIIVSKTFLENQAENTVFLFQISNIEWNLYSVKRFLPFVRLYSSWALQSRGILGTFKIVTLLFPSSVGFQSGSIPSVVRNWKV